MKHIEDTNDDMLLVHHTELYFFIQHCACALHLELDHVHIDLDNNMDLDNIDPKAQINNYHRNKYVVNQYITTTNECLGGT